MIIADIAFSKNIMERKGMSNIIIFAVDGEASPIFVLLL